MKYEFADVRDQIGPSLRAKIDRQEPLTPEEKLEIKAKCYLGDTCGCDDDHHSRELHKDAGSKRINFSS